MAEIRNARSSLRVAFLTSTLGPANVKAWTGSAWVDATAVRYWTGSAWVDATAVKAWTGSAWVP